MTDTQVAEMKGKHPLVVYRERFEGRASELKAMGVSPERFVRAATTAAQLNPEILGCSWKSIWDSAVKACRAGLLPDGIQAAFVPYKGTCTFLPMVRGVVGKFYEAGSARWVTANCVYEGDQFDHYIDEHGEHLRHTPSDTFDDKKILRVYGMATTTTGGVFIAVMSRAEVDKHRGFSRTKREDAPWVVHYSEMAKKTVLHRLAKLMPNAPQFDEDTSSDEDEDERPQLTAVPRPAGATAALDMFAGSPDGDAAPETAASVDDRQAGEAATAGPDAPVAADAPVALAYQQGKDAKASGATRKALPGEYRMPGTDDLADAWFRGHDGK